MLSAGEYFTMSHYLSGLLLLAEQNGRLAEVRESLEEYAAAFGDDLTIDQQIGLDKLIGAGA